MGSTDAEMREFEAQAQEDRLMCVLDPVGWAQAEAVKDQRARDCARSTMLVLRRLELTQLFRAEDLRDLF